MTRSIGAADITGLVLAGGRGARMGGIDKGLQDFRGRPLALNAVERLRPQVGRVAVNANRNLPVYETFGLPVWPDSLADHPGPLAGFLTGLAHCQTPWLLTVPCDSPRFPLDLAARLAGAAVAQDADVAMASAPERQSDGTANMRAQPVFCLLRVDLLDSLAHFTHDGGRKVADWVALHRHVTVRFDDADAFANANTPAELHALQTQENTPCPSNSGSPSSPPPPSS